MDDFMDWLLTEAPEWAIAIVIIVGALSLITAFVLSMAALAAGYWIFPLLLWIVLPAYIVIRAYLKDRNNDT